MAKLRTIALVAVPLLGAAWIMTPEQPPAPVPVVVTEADRAEQARLLIAGSAQVLGKPVPYYAEPGWADTPEREAMLIALAKPYERALR